MAARWWIVALFVLALAGEVVFRLELRRRRLTFIPPKHYRQLYVAPHPYLPYTMKANMRVGNAETQHYPLHPGRYGLQAFSLNNRRMVQDRDVAWQKRPGTTRILCLGASTTANSIWEAGRRHSYPLELQAALDAALGTDRCEVINGGTGGWTTAEILVSFALYLIDLRPDVMLLYHGVNDLEASLTAEFEPDYSHSRRNFGEAVARIRLASRFPAITWWKSYMFLKSRWIGFGNSRHDLLKCIRVRPADWRNPFRGLATERRNVDHLIQLCRANGIHVVLSTFAYHVYRGVAEDPLVLKYRDGVAQENGMLRELADRYGLPLADVAAAVPDQDDYFLDTMHFTPAGMRLVAQQFAARVLPLVPPASAPAPSPACAANPA
jgi:lysophospholipase L1-like esterase